MEWHIGHRLSYEGKSCTVRYFGKIRDKEGLWLGVEWDNETIGKHDGSLNDHRYFSCKTILIPDDLCMYESYPKLRARRVTVLPMFFFVSTYIRSTKVVTLS